MNAKDALILSQSNRMDNAAITESVETMAQAGYRYMTVAITKIRNVDESVTHFSDLGYDVKITKEHFCLKW